ncbi:MAG TPA: hypothetical protein VG318_16235 [Actinomycetota bacterium]|nr:hypothetical protein [Actinomycetota bacterium]
MVDAVEPARVLKEIRCEVDSLTQRWGQMDEELADALRGFELFLGVRWRVRLGEHLWNQDLEVELQTVDLFGCRHGTLPRLPRLLMRDGLTVLEPLRPQHCGGAGEPRE